MARGVQQEALDLLEVVGYVGQTTTEVQKELRSRIRLSNRPLNRLLHALENEGLVHCSPEQYGLYTVNRWHFNPTPEVV